MDIAFNKFQSLLEANRILSSTLNLPELLRQVMRLATEVVEAETSSLLLYDDKTNELIFDIALTDKESDLKQIRLKPGEGIAGWVAREKKTQIINDTAADPRWARRADDKIQFQTRSVLAVPLIYRGALLGVVETINKKEGDFTQEDAKVLEAFAAQSSVSIVNARMFENLQEEKEKIEATFAQMSDGALFCDAAGRKLFANTAAEKLLGRENTGHALVNEIFSDFSVLPSFSAIAAAGEKSVPVEFCRTAGKTLYLSGMASRICDSSNKVLGSLIIFRDTTAEKKESLVKRNFLSLISHKLKTPLVSILGYVPLLLKESSLTEFQQKALSSILRQGTHLANLVDKLLHFTLVEGQDLVLTKSGVEFSDLAGQSLASLRSFTEERGARVTIGESVAKLPRTLMDAEKMEAVLRSLIENAIKFNQGEEKEVLIEGILEGEGHAGLVIKDNGPGIPAEEREKIFHRFYQIEESFTGQVEGAGLGLPLVKQVVEAHRGRVWVESSLGAGSSFSFVLPVKEVE